MSTVSDKPSGNGAAIMDFLAAELLIAVLSVAVLYPEAYISNSPRIFSKQLLPLALLVPAVALGTIVYLYARRDRIRLATTDFALAIYMVYLLARNVFNPSWAVSIKYAVLGLGIFYLVTMVFQLATIRRMMLWFVGTLLLATSLYGIIEYFRQDNLIYGSLTAEYVPQHPTGPHRSGSTIAHPVTFAGFLVQVIPFSILAWLKGDGRWLRILGAAATATGLLVLLLTFSKGGWLAVALTGLIFLVLGFRKLSAIKVPLLVIAAVLLISAGVFWQEAVSETTSNRSENSVNIRWVAWESAWAGFIDHPLVGVGLKQGQEEVKRQTDPEWLELAAVNVPVDNNYLNLLLEEGLIGALLWLTFFVLLTREGIRNSRRAEFSGWAWAAMASIVAITIDALTFEAMIAWPTYLFFWFAAGTIHGISQTGRLPAEPAV